MGRSEGVGSVPTHGPAEVKEYSSCFQRYVQTPESIWRAANCMWIPCPGVKEDVCFVQLITAVAGVGLVGWGLVGWGWVGWGWFGWLGFVWLKLWSWGG